MAGGSSGIDLLADSDDMAALRSLAREVADKEIAPRAATWDREGLYPDEAIEAFRATGLFGITTGVEYGGAGLDDVASTVVLEEIARADINSAILLQITYNGAPRAIEHFGTDAAKQRWLPDAASGDALFCIGITEAEAGSSVGEMRAALRPDGDGYRLDAYKNYTTGGHRAAACLVWARFPGGEGGRGIGSVVVDLTRDGVTVAGTHDNMGIRAATEAELVFEDVRIDPDDVVVAGDPNDNTTFKQMLGELNHERCGNAAMCVGAAQGALEHATRYANERVLNGKKLTELQGISWKLADMAIEIESARLLLYRAVALAGPGGTPPALETAMAKAKANLAAKFVCDEAIQIMGGYGYSREFPVEKIYRDVRGLNIGAGTVEVQRNYVGARIAAGRPPAGPAWR